MHTIKNFELLRLASQLKYKDVTETVEDFNCLPTEWITDIRFTEIKNIAQITIESGTFISSPGMFSGLHALCNSLLQSPAAVCYKPRDYTQPVSGLIHYRILYPSGGLYDKYPKDAPVWLDNQIRVQNGRAEIDSGELYQCELEVKRDMYIIYTGEDPQMPEFSPTPTYNLVMRPGKYYASVTAAAYSDILDRLNTQKIKSHVVYQYCVDQEATNTLQVQNISRYNAVMAAVHQNRASAHQANVHHARVIRV